MNSSTSTEHPEKVFEAKVFTESSVNNLTGNGHEFPALGTDIGSLTTRSDLIVIRHIDIEHQFSLKRLDVANRSVLLGPDRHDGTNIDLVRVPVANFPLQLFLGLKGLIAKVDVVGQREGELPVSENRGFGWKRERLAFSIDCTVIDYLHSP